MSLSSRAARAYRRGGLSRVIRGGLNLGLKIIERRTIQKTEWKYPYYEKKYKNRSRRAMNKLSRKGIGPRITDVSLEKYKTSDKLFVLGSGSSINEISEEMWDHIAVHDSIGLNRWPVHDFVPTYHVFELKLRPGYEEYNSIYLDLLETKKEEYRDVPVILKNTDKVRDTLHPEYLPEWLQDELIVSCDSAFTELVRTDSDVEDNIELLTYLNERGYFDKGNIELLYRKRASISYLLHLATVLGYEEVILCGVDMIDSEYFFEQNRDYYQSKGIPIPEHSSDKKDGSHKTNDPDFGELTLEMVIYSMNDTIFEPKGIDLYVENEISALHPTIPEYYAVLNRF